MNVFDTLETANNQADDAKLWKGTFREFLKKYEEEKENNANIGVLAHQRLYNMILAGGTKKVDHFGKERISYEFFEETLYGIEDSLDEIVQYLHSAAQKTETSRRMLLMYGPPSSGKSEIVQHLKRGLEDYTQTPEGSIYALSGTKMHENPFLLIPEKLRGDFEKQFGLRIEGQLSPVVAYKLREEFHGKFMDYPVEQIHLSEATRKGIGTWLPSDPKTVCTDTTRVFLEGKGITRLSTLYSEVVNEFKDGFANLDVSAAALSEDEHVKGIYDHQLLPMYRADFGGMWLDCTDKHRIMTLDENGDFKWLELREIDESTPVLVKTGLRKFGKDQDLPNFDEQPMSMTPDLAEMIGGLVAEGSCCSSALFYHNTDERLVIRFKFLVKNTFLSELNSTYRKKNSGTEKTTDLYTATTTSVLIGCNLKTKISRWINCLFGLDCLACDKRVPERVLSSSQESQTRFLEGLFLGDGSIRYRKGTPRFSYGSCSETLAMDVQAMLLNFGFFARIDIGTNKKFPKNKQYTVVCEGDQVFNIARLCPVFAKHRHFEISTKHTGVRGFEYFGQLRGLIKEIRENTRGTRSLIDRRYCMDTHNSRSPSRRSLEKWKSELQTSIKWTDSLKKDQIVSKMDKMLSYVPVRMRSKRFLGIRYGVDLSCDSEIFSYIANGMVSHNSQDQSELVGGIDFAKIQEYGDEADPRTYNFNGELNVANRGIMEFIEGLKSLKKDTYIPTSSGIKKIGDIHGPEKDILVAHERVVDVNSGEDTGQIIRSCFKGKALCRRVKTKKGYFFVGSVDHRVKTLNKNGYMEWKPVCGLSKGDIIPISTRGIWAEIAPSVGSVRKISRPRLRLPKRMTRKIARFLGYYVSEGSYNKWSVCISNVNQHVIGDVFSIAESFGLNSRYDKKGHSMISSVELVDFLKGCGLCGNDSDLKIVPQIILDSPKQYVVEFLRAYFDGDGTVNDHRISCTSSSVELIDQLHILLLNFGVISQTSKFWNEEYEKYYYFLSMDSIYRDLFMKEIGFNIDYKNPKAQRTVRKRADHRHVVDCHYLFRDLLEELKNKCLETSVSVSSKHYSRSLGENALVSRRVYNHLWAWSNQKRCPSISEIRRILPEIPDGLEHKNVLSNLVRGDLYFDTVDEIGPEHFEEIYDVHETTQHSYVGNGLIHHNSDERFLRVLLTATQEKMIKAPRFGLIYCDTVILLHTNEEEFKNFMAEKKYEAYHDRMVIVKVPYNLSVSNEVRIYEKLLNKSDAIKNMHIAPKTLLAAAMFAVLTRLAPPPEGGELTLAKKMKLYDKQHVRGHKIEQVPDMKRKEPKEGMTGVSPRFTIDQISASIANARDEGRAYITPLDVLRQLNKGIFGRDSFTQDKKNHFESLIDEARNEWDDLLRNDIQKAFFVSYEKEARNLCENYLDQIDAACAGTKPRDPVTGDEIDLDEKLMDSVEEQIDITSSGKEDFRNEILRAVGAVARANEKKPPEEQKKFDYTQHSQLREAIQKKLFEERKNVIRMTVSTRNPDTDELKKINDVVARMVDQQGYSADSANALLKYATAHLFDK